MANSTPIQKQKRQIGTKLIFTLAIVLLGASLWAWWHYVRSSPERTFYAALDNSLRTKSVSKQIEQSSPGQTFDQQAGVVFGPEHSSYDRTVQSQEGDDVETTVETETISTPDYDYVRYLTIDTTQENKSGDQLDFTELEGLWGKSSRTEAQPLGELYTDTVLGIVPFADLSSDQRMPLMEYIRDKKVYQFDADKVERRIENGRPVYIYEVTVAPEAYVGLLKELAKAIGLKQLEQVDPSVYRDAPPVTVQFAVDVWARHLTGVAYEGGARTETFSGYGILYDATEPEETMPLEELQKRLQKVQ